MTGNWTNTNPTLDQALSDDYNYGSWQQCSLMGDASSTADLGLASGGGGITMHRMSNPWTVPSVSSPVIGYCVTKMDLLTYNNNTGIMGGLEFLLGTLTVSGNSFSAGPGMPIRTVRGTSLQLGSMMAFAVVKTSLGGATTPTLTFTYTNQSGTTGQTGTIVLPTNPTVNSAFLLNYRLASGDTGIQAVTNMSISAGTSGVINIYGFMVMSMGGQSTASGGSGQVLETQSTPLPKILCVPNDTIAFYVMGNGGSQFMCHLTATPET